MDSYQAIYDAVRSRIFDCDVGQIVREACALDASFAIDTVKQEFLMAATEMQRPSVLFRPLLSVDGNQWCALYGDNLQEGMAGFGPSPEAAMRDFDVQWYKRLKA